MNGFEAALKLPPLREDLALHPGGTQRDGSPSWIIEDPLKGRYYQIGWLEFEVLSRWSLGDVKSIIRSIAEETLLAPEVEEILIIRQFFEQHELLLDANRLNKATRGSHLRPSLATRLLHNYLMFRIPLVNPDRMLGRLLPFFAPFLSTKAFVWSAFAGAIGLLLSFQQWDRFASAFIDTLSLQGLFFYFLALSVAKFLHELGHAFTAKAMGLRVPRMGVAIVLLLPMLYTDTGESWRLTRRADRFAIAAAGMRIELMLAAWSTLAWHFLPDGAIRGAVFFLATTSWIMTLVVNASPFMRFDGYYMMSDATGIPNLHEHAGRQVRHFLRAKLLGIADPAPLLNGAPAPGWLLWFGFCSALYRFFLFLGIAVAVYHYFFKALGIFLFGVEIWWFILKPVIGELRGWWNLRGQIDRRSALISGSIICLALVLLALPLRGQVNAHGWVRSGQEFAIYAPKPARLVHLPQTGAVEAHQSIASLQSPDLQLREARATAKIGALESRLSASNGSDQTLESVRSTREQWAQQWTEVAGVDAEARQLELSAPFPGIVLDVATDLSPGQVVTRQELLGRLIDPTRWIAEAYVDEDEVRRIRSGAKVRAYLLGAKIEVIEGSIEIVDDVPVDQLASEILAARFGGPIHTIDDPNVLKPLQILYRVRIALNKDPELKQARLGAFAIEGEQVSVIGKLLRDLIGTFVLQVSF